jgi:hypothetical protein
LSNEVNDEVLFQAFSAFGSISEARVMWDMKTGRSRGYGFVAFRDRPDAEKALSSMDGEWLGSRAIRCNWANQKGQPSISQQQAMAAMGMSPATSFSGHHQFPAQGVQSYDMVVAQTPQWQTTCYVGNLTPYTTQGDIVPLFQNFGYVVETRFSADRGFAFVKMDSHENAAMAICQLSGYNVNGRPLKCSVSKSFLALGILLIQFFSGERIVLLLANSESPSLLVLSLALLNTAKLQPLVTSPSILHHLFLLKVHLLSKHLLPLKLVHLTICKGMHRINKSHNLLVFLGMVRPKLVQVVMHNLLRLLKALELVDLVKQGTLDNTANIRMGECRYQELQAMAKTNHRLGDNVADLLELRVLPTITPSTSYYLVFSS